MENTMQTRIERYPGPHSFSTDRAVAFRGRDTEIRSLTDLVYVEKIAVLFSKSGIGKSSLIEAGLVPKLGQLGIFYVPMRLNKPEFSLKKQFFENLKKAGATFQTQPPLLDESHAAALENLTIWELLKRAHFEDESQKGIPLLVFDQFEELFTLYLTDRKDEREAFLLELADLANERMPTAVQQNLREMFTADHAPLTDDDLNWWERRPPCKVLFAIRSDFLHYADDVSHYIPLALKNRFQIYPLSQPQAEKAIVEPALLEPVSHYLSPTFEYEQAALHDILKTLSGDRDEVEPFQLQILCQNIERKIVREQGATAVGPTVVTPAFYRLDPPPADGTDAAEAGLQAILTNFYMDAIADLPDDWEPTARLLIENALITESGRRRSKLADDLISEDNATPELLDALEKARLLRKELRLKAYYYEISHDTLVAPILTARAARLLAESQFEECFYEKRLLEMHPTQLPVVRDLIEKNLLNEAGQRRSATLTELTDGLKISPEFLDELVSMRLLSMERRRGQTYFNISNEALLPEIVQLRTQQQAAEKAAARARDERDRLKQLEKEQAEQAENLRIQTMLREQADSAAKNAQTAEAAARRALMRVRRTSRIVILLGFLTLGLIAFFIYASAKRQWERAFELSNREENFNEARLSYEKASQLVPLFNDWLFDSIQLMRDRDSLVRRFRIKLDSADARHFAADYYEARLKYDTAIAIRKSLDFLKKPTFAELEQRRNDTEKIRAISLDVFTRKIQIFLEAGRPACSDALIFYHKATVLLPPEERKELRDKMKHSVCGCDD